MKLALPVALCGADLTVAEDVAGLPAPFIPGAGVVDELLPALGLLVLAMELLNIQGGYGADIGPGEGGKIGAGR
jgi:hypothetical protein